ncbi:unnamed protein product, partial [marine sediment metagenome]
ICIYWSPSETIDFNDKEDRILKVNKPLDISIYSNFDRTSVLQL